MLSQRYRFHSRGGVRYVYQKGQTFRVANLSLVSCRNQRGFRRVAVVVSKKILKSAVGRNRIRRRVYEAMRLNFPHQFPPRDYVFVVYHSNILNLPFSELSRQVSELITLANRS